jgi:SPP1 gp7 family putative phage head morphogenesis protein
MSFQREVYALLELAGMETRDLVKADRLITRTLGDVLFSKAAANEVEAFQAIYRAALEKALRSQYARFEEIDLTGDLEKLLKSAERILGKDLAEKLEPEATRHLFRAFKAGKAMNGIPRSVQAVFTEAHGAALDWLAGHDRFWIGKVFPSHMRESFKHTITRGLKDGLGRKDIAKRLRALTFGSGKVPGKVELYNRVVSASVNRARNWGSLFAMEEAEIETYAWRAVGDERTCSRCSYLDGMEFSVPRMMGRVRLAIEKSPEDIEWISPWPTHDQARDDYYIRTKAGREYLRGKPTSWLEERGVGIPPLHGSCRCTTTVI